MMPAYRYLCLFIVLFALHAGANAARADEPLAPNKPVPLAGTHGKFDFIKIDANRNRLLACHTGNGSLDVIDLASSKLIKSVPTGAAQGVAIDEKEGRYFVSASKPPQLVIVDAKTLEITGTIPLPAPADLNAYNAVTDRVFVCNDANPELWLINPETKILLGTYTYPGKGMEDLAFDAGDAHLFQNLKEASLLAEINPTTGDLLAKWPTAPALNPHGLAMTGTNSVLIAGGNGTLSLIDLATGQVLGSAPISPKVDEIAYDLTFHRAYCASGLGTISVVALDGNKLTPLGSVPSSPGAHSIAVDPRSHAVWIVFTKEGKPFVQSFSPN
jgi:DNA-binding beta-propeller fold protein YncE